MGAKFLLFLLTFGGGCTGCFGATLHIGNAQVPLSDTRHTSPSLAIGMNGVTYLGALYSDNAPAGTLRLNVGGVQYWLGEYCAPGTYLPSESGVCTECGLGHYCAGGQHRAACSGGIIGCPGTRASADVAAPTFINRELTVDEIWANVPATDLSQWRQISCCATSYSSYFSTLQNDLSAVNYVQGCANGVLGTGTYLFTERTWNFCTPSTIDPFTGNVGEAYTAHLMIFEHPVSYKTIHASNYYYQWLDVDGPDFTEWDLHVPSGFYCAADVRANISGLENVPRGVMCVYELQ